MVYIGGAGNDIISGSSLGTKVTDEIDWLTGCSGADSFYLSQGSYFFNMRGHGFTYLGGDKSFAVITDYNKSEGDSIVFHEAKRNQQVNGRHSIAAIPIPELYSLADVFFFDEQPAVGIYLRFMPERSGPVSMMDQKSELLAIVLGKTTSNFFYSDIIAKDFSFIKHPGWTGYI